MDTEINTDTPVARLDDIAEGSMKMVKVDGRRVCLVRTSSGLHALDHACPHEGYGLSQGQLDGDVVTCAWHNWKFRVSDGECIQGEEGVQTHRVDVDDEGSVRVALDRPDPATLRPKLMASLRKAIEKHYVGQISRDVVRLLKAGASPHEIMAVAVEYGVPRGEYGWGHSIASATDCLAMVDLWAGDERALPLVQGIAGIAETMRDRPERPLAPLADDVPVSLDAFREAVEREDLATAQSLVRAALARGASAATLTTWFAAVVSDHHLSYGHGAIYTQKAFELLELIGWDAADAVLGHLVTSIVTGTREDTLPYMRPFLRELAEIDLVSLAESTSTDADAHWDSSPLIEALLDGDRVAPVRATEQALMAGAGVHGVLDAVVDAVSERMLRYDVTGERDLHDDFGWLDITHGITYAHAARWLLERTGNVDADMLRLAFFTVFQANWTGRHEWHTDVATRAVVTSLGADVTDYGDELQRRSQLDGTTAFIVHAHAVKTSRAAAIESARRNVTGPLDATLHFLESPKLERFVAANVTRSIDFLNGRTQRD